MAMARIHGAGMAICLGILALSPDAFAAEPRDSGVTSPLESLPESIWQAGLDSTARHVQTGLACPFEVNGFTLQNVMTYDAVGFDVGCNYIASAGNAVTVYLTRRGQQSLQDDLARADMELQYAYGDAEPLTAEVPNLSEDIAFLSSLYLLPQHGAHSGIWVADYSGWTLKLRATYPASDPTNAAEAMTAILENADVARTHLALCVDTASYNDETRTGQPLHGIEDTIPAMVRSLLTFTPGPHGPNAPVVPEPQWCVTSVIVANDVSFLHWFNRNAGNHGPFERLSRPDRPDAGSFISYRNSLSDAAWAEEQRETTGIYDIAWDREEGADLLAIFDGRPTLEVLAGIALAETHLVLGHYDRATGETTFYNPPP